MKAQYLLPAYFRTLGVLLAVPGLILGFLFLFYGYVIPGFAPPVVKGQDMLARFDSYTNELALTLTIVGLVFIAFSKLKKEDELTAQLRLNALYWAILINYLLIIVFFLLLYIGALFFGYTDGNAQVLDYNLFMPLVIFIARFYYLLYKNRNEYYVRAVHFLPYKPFNKIAKFIAIPCIILFVAHIIYNIFTSNDFYQKPPLWYTYSDFVIYVMPVILLVWIYTRERIEDEYINSIRLQAMQIAIYINCIVLLLANFFLYSLDFWSFEFFELIIMPLIFVVVFQYRLFRLSRQAEGKKNNKLNINTL